MKKKCFLIRYSVSDNGHDHTDYAKGYYKDYDTAVRKTAICHTEDGMDAEYEIMSFGDGLTITEVCSVQEISDSELAVLNKFFPLADVSR